MVDKLPFRKIVDLSVPFKSLGTHVFPGYPMPLRATMTTIRDNGYYSSVWTFVEHSGTHVDAPGHFLQGAPTIDKVPLSTYVGRGVVLKFTGRRPNYSITKKDIETGLRKKELKGKVGSGWVLLFYTGYSAKAGTRRWLEHPELSDEACRLITRLKVNAIGFDAPSPDHAPFPAHKILLPKGIALFEGLTNLNKVMDKDFVFVGAPLPLVDGSASPVRAFALMM
ncbi:MAG: cyclase family protein [Nitrososphaerales archaeon]|nr:cyclase family protein [Nitrososphaerales archaeon]